MFRKNTAGQFIHFQGVDATTGGIKSGVTWTIRRCIDGTFAAGGGTVTEDSTNGWYKYAMSQADTNGNDIGFNFTGSGAVPQTVNIITTAADPTDSVRFGLTALPNAAAEAAGGLYTRGSGAGQITQSTNGQIDVDTKKINSVSASSVTTVNANQGTTQPVNFTGTAGSALVKSDTVDIAGAAVSASSAQVGVNVVQVNAVSAASVTTINANQGTTQPLNFTGTAASALVKGDAIDINSVAASSVTTISANLGTTQPVNFTGTAGSALVKSDSVDIGSVAQTGLDIAANYTAARATKLDNLDAAVSSRSTLTQAQVISDATPFPGADIDAAVSSRAPSATALSTANWTNARAAFIDNLNVLKIKKNTALANFGFMMVLSADHITPATGLTVAVQRSIDGGAFGNATNSPATEIASGCYKISLSAADMNGDIIILKMTSATADQRTIIIATEP